MVRRQFIQRLTLASAGAGIAAIATAHANLKKW